MVMALCAIQAASEEDADLLRHSVGGRADPVIGNEVTRSGIVTVRGDPFAGDLVVRHVLFYEVTDPFPILLAPLRRQSIREDRYAEYVGKTESPIIYKFGRRNECVHHFLPLFRIIVEQEFAHPLRRRENTGQIQADATEEFAIT